MRSIAVIVGSIILIYGTISTAMHDTLVVGKIGKRVGELNIKLFGYLAYIDFLLLIYPLYSFYRYPIKRRAWQVYLGWILFIFSAIILQTLLVGTEHSGLLGLKLYNYIFPFIGLVGVWLFWFMLSILSVLLLFEMEWDILEIVDDFINRVFKNFKRDEKVKKSYIKLPNFFYDFLDFINEVLDSLANKIFYNPFYYKRNKEAKELIDMNLEPIDNFNKNISNRLESTIKTVEQDEPTIQDCNDFDNVDELEDILPSSDIQNSNYEEPKEDKKIKKKSERENKPKDNLNVEIVNKLEENSKILENMEKGKVAKPKNFQLPKIDFLAKPPRSVHRVNEAEIDRKIRELLDKLERFKIEGDVVRTYSGPLVTTFEFKPLPHVKVSKILGLQDDLAMALRAQTIRIQAPIPGRDVVGIEIPNDSFETIYLREILESKIFKNSKSPLTVALGKDIVGNPFITDLKRLPHLLIAGTTGSGKSVGINAMLLSLLYRNDPDHLKLILIDPKMLEFSIYNDIPHLLTPVIIEPKKAIVALANMVREMERRYKVMSKNRVKNIDNYNHKARKNGEEEMPFIVVVIDELADLMMNGGKEVEYSIARLAQMARAAGIHLVIATQRPSVDVVTGLIKANLPSRLAYRVGQRIDSKVILDQMGADSLLGRGDALFTPPGATGLVRLHAPWNSEEEIERVIEFIKAQREPEYDQSYIEESGGNGNLDSDIENLDPLYEEAKNIIINDKKTSISYLQRKLQIGYNRSANLIEQLEHTGVLSAPNNKGQRELLI